MKELINKLKQKELKIAKEKGNFHLFALFLRDGLEDKWDLVVAAPWIDKDKAKALNYLALMVQNTLSPDELIKITRLVIIDDTNPALKAIQKAVRVTHGILEVKNSVFFGFNIKHAYIITSEKKDTTTQPTGPNPSTPGPSP